jgi:beta-lactamase regulating signal transducer with metallopeptidase domain
MTSLPPHWLLMMTVAGVLSFLLAQLACLVLRRRAAALRHFIWMVALVAPVTVAMLANVHVGIPVWYPATAPVPTARFSSPEGVTMSAEGERSRPPFSFVHGRMIATNALSPRLPANRWLLVWSAGAVVVGLSLGVANVRARRFWMARITLADHRLHCLLEELAADLDIRRLPRLYLAEIGVPFCLGIRRPVVVFPAASIDWDQERIRICLLHELAHIQRRDLLAQAGILLACTISWFNPFVWLAAARAREEAENAADDVVLNHRVTPESYATHLVAIPRHTTRRAAYRPWPCRWREPIALRCESGASCSRGRGQRRNICSFVSAHLPPSCCSWRSACVWRPDPPSMLFRTFTLRMPRSL